MGVSLLNTAVPAGRKGFPFSDQCFEVLYFGAVDLPGLFLT